MMAHLFPRAQPAPHATMHIAPKSPAEIIRQHRLFEIALLLKGLNGIVELAGGMLVLFVPLRTVNQLVLWLTASEIEDDPNDWLARTLIDAAEKLSMGTKLYASFYLLAHGAIKLLLVYFSGAKNPGRFRWAYR